jgi:hypothetical protein
MNLIKAGLILLVAILVLLPIAVWTYNLVILNSVFETKANINYIDIVMQHGNVFASFFLFLLPTIVNPFTLKLLLDKDYRSTKFLLMLSLLISVFSFFVFREIPVKLSLIENSKDPLEAYVRLLYIVYVKSFPILGRDLYENLAAFDMIELLFPMFVNTFLIYFISYLIFRFKTKITYTSALKWFELLGSIPSLIENVSRGIVFFAFTIFVFFFYPSLSYDITYEWWRYFILFSYLLSLVYTFAPIKKNIRNRILLVVIIIIVLGFLAPMSYFKVFGGWDANKQTYEFLPKIMPHIEFVKLLNNLNITETYSKGGNVKDVANTRLTNTQFILSKARFELAKLGISWITIDSQPMIIFRNGKVYWVVFTSPTLVEKVDVETTSTFVFTHSEVILAFDGSTGDPVSLREILGINKQVPIYYGIGGLFSSKDIVFVGSSKWKEAGNFSFTSTPDYTFEGINRFLYFLMKGRLDIALGSYGEKLNAIMIRDSYKRVSMLLIPYLSIEKDPRAGTPAPYPVVDEDGNLYLAFNIFIDKRVGSGYADTSAYSVETEGNFRRNFGVVLVNVQDGSITGYMYDDIIKDNNYIVNYAKSFYKSWKNKIPDWLLPKVRLPKNLMWSLIDLYNTYRINSSDYESWYKATGMFDFPRDSNGSLYSQNIFDIRYVPFEGKFVAVCPVENYHQQGTANVNIIGMYLFNSTGRYFLSFTSNVPRLSAIVDYIRHYPTVQQILTLHQTSGNPWIEGNLMVHLVNGNPIFILPYYSISSQTAFLTMVVAYNPSEDKIGIYEVKDVTNPNEVNLAAELAYLSTLRNVTFPTSKVNITEIIVSYLLNKNFKVLTPTLVNPNVVYQVSYLSSNFNLQQLNSTLDYLIEKARNYKINTINIWKENVEGKYVINVAVLALTNQGVEMYVVRIKLDYYEG